MCQNTARCLRTKPLFGLKSQSSQSISAHGPMSKLRVVPDFLGALEPRLLSGHKSELPRELVKNTHFKLHPRETDSLCSQWGPEICILKITPNNLNIHTGLVTTHSINRLKNILSWFKWADSLSATPHIRCKELIFQKLNPPITYLLLRLQLSNNCNVHTTGLYAH